MRIAVSDLRPNPFRHLKRYPINSEKVDALVRSIKDTTFWDNLLVRKASNGDDGYEIAYGHHRLKALTKARVDEIDVPVRKLTDTDMARIMAHENMEEWGHSSAIEQETVRSIIEGYAQGKIELPQIKAGERGAAVRIAPSFVPVRDGVNKSGRSDLFYTAETLAEFLGWKAYKVEATLAALSLIEDELATEEQFKDLSTEQARRIASETRRVAKETGKPGLARSVGKKLAAGMRKAVKGHDKTGKERNVQDVTIHNARQRANELMAGERRREAPKELPPIDRFATELAVALADIFPTPRMEEKLAAVIKYRDELGARDRQRLVGALRKLAERAERYAEKLEE